MSQDERCGAGTTQRERDMHLRLQHGAFLGLNLLCLLVFLSSELCLHGSGACVLCVSAASAAGLMGWASNNWRVQSLRTTVDELVDEMEDMMDVMDNPYGMPAGQIDRLTGILATRGRP